MSKPIEEPLELVRPDYNIYQYTEQIYKIVRFKGNRTACRLGKAEKHETYDHKLDASLSRARRVVLELALCNPWDWFCTFTINESKFDRKDLVTWRDTFTQWLRDQRKKGLDIQYVLVPEKHKDGSWHAHGLFRFGDNSHLVSFEDLRRQGLKVPDHLVYGGYYDWPEYRAKFGFCSFGKIKNRIAAGFYVTKYLTKEASDMVSQVGLHTYYASHGLNKAVFHGDIYGNCQYLDTFLSNHYDFCDTGMTHESSGLGWDFALEYMQFEPLEAVTPEVEQEFGEYMECVQLMIEDYSGGAHPW